MKSILIAGALSLSLTTSTTVAVPSITKIETIGSTGLQGFVTTPYLKPGVPKTYWIYGPWLDYAQTIWLNGVRMGKLGTGDKMVKVMLVVPAGTPRGMQQLKVTIDCGFALLLDCKSVALTRNVMVLGSGTVTSVTPNVDVPLNTPVNLVVSGTNMMNTAIIKSKSSFNGAMYTERTSSSFKVTGTTASCGSAILMIGDQAEGGDMYPYGTLLVKTNQACGYVPPPRTMTGGCPAGTSYNTTTKTCQ